MNDFTVKDLIELLKSIPQDSRVYQHSGERDGILYIVSKNGNKAFSITKTGEIK